MPNQNETIAHSEIESIENHQENGNQNEIVTLPTMNQTVNTAVVADDVIDSSVCLLFYLAAVLVKTFPIKLFFVL